LGCDKKRTTRTTLTQIRARKNPMHTCAFGSHEHSTIAIEEIQQEKKIWSWHE
jgi:hypothetical protein